MDDLQHTEGHGLTRRASLVRLGAILAGVLGASAWRSGRSDASGGAAASPSAGPAGVASGAVTCVLTPEQTEGPYYIGGEKLRRDIADGKPGTPLTLRLVVVDVSTCQPIAGAAVDIWHCDAAGTYSGFGQGAGNRTFLRGIQRTDAKGVATFRTIYPGWYPGRTVHVHVKVHVRGNVVHTGQLYFPDKLTDSVYGSRPYSGRPNRTTRNADDFVFANGGKRSMLSLRRRSAGYAATLTMGVHTA
jgi:protocatechuate 3,4-dioxygenase beta subunit